MGKKKGRGVEGNIFPSRFVRLVEKITMVRDSLNWLETSAGKYNEYILLYRDIYLCHDMIARSYCHIELT